MYMWCYMYNVVCMYMRIPENHNSLGCEQPPGLDVNQSLIAQDAFWPILGLISCAGATRSVGVTCIGFSGVVT